MNRIVHRLIRTTEKETGKNKDFYESNKEELQTLEKMYGEFEQYYASSNHVLFVKHNEKFPKSEQEKWFLLWGSVVKKAYQQFRSYNACFELDEDNKDIVEWIDSLEEFGEGNRPGKVFFKPVFYGDVHTYYDWENDEIDSIDYHPKVEDIKFEYLGSKL